MLLYNRYWIDSCFTSLHPIGLPLFVFSRCLRNARHTAASCAQMPLSCRIVAACLNRAVNFYDMLTGEFVCRIAGLGSPPTCVDCTQVGYYGNVIYQLVALLRVFLYRAF